MTQVRLSKDAADYLRRESHYLQSRNPAAARRFKGALLRARTLLQTFPEAGNRGHALMISGGRSLVVDDYIFGYQITGGQIDILTIRHARMQMPVPEIDAATDAAGDLD